MVAFVHSLRLNFLGKHRLSPLLPLSQSGKRETTAWIGMNLRCFSSSAEVSDVEIDDIHDDGGAMEKENALRHALMQLDGDFGKESMLSLQRFFGSRRASVISTGSLKLDLALGIGGLPKGRIVEIYGREASGKTTLAFNIIKEAQKLGGNCAYIDVENAMDPLLAESMGVDIENLLIFPPNSAENLLSAVDILTKSGSVDVIVVDSVAALVPQKELDTSIGGSEGMQSRIMTQALRKIHYSLCQSQTLIIFLNQVRSSLRSGQSFLHADEVTCGGNALKFYSAVRLRTMRSKLLKTDDKITGLGVCVQVVKNKLAPAMKKAELGIKFGKGLCCESEVLELASEYGVIMKNGENFVIEGKAFSNEYAAEQYLAKNDEVLGKIVTTLRENLFEQGDNLDRTR